MLNVMRKYAGSWMIKVLLSAIVIVFVFWGVGSFRSRKEAQVATVNGEIISIEEYQKAYNNMIENYRRQYGNRIDEQMLKQLQLNKQAVEQLIDQKVLRQESEKLGFQVTDQELAERIRSNPTFQNNGVFDKRRYTRLIEQNRLSLEEFETGMKEQLAINKLQNFIVSSVKVSDDEIWNWYDHENKTVNIEYVAIKPDSYKEINLSEDQIKRYFDENKENYKTELQIKAQYLYFDPQDFLSNITVSDDDVREYYENHPEEFHQEKTVEARHILFKVEQNASEEAEKKARLKAEKVLKMAREGQNFEELAKTHSEGPSKDVGGALGSFTKDKMVKPFADAAFALNAGEISDLVKTQFGWHIIKVEKVNPENTKSLEKATSGIRAELIDARSKSSAYDRAEEVLTMFFSGEDLNQVATDQGLTIHKTDFFTREGPKTGVNDSRQFATAAFELEQMDISEVKEIGKGFYIIQPFDKKEPEIPSLETVMDRVKSDLTSEKQKEMAEKDAKSILEALRKDDNFSEAAAPFGLSVKETGFFKRTGNIPGIGYESAISAAAFELNDKDKISKNVIEGNQGFYIFRLKDHKGADTSAFKGQQDQIRERLLQEKKYSTMRTYLEELKQRSQIKIQDKIIQ